MTDKSLLVWEMNTIDTRLICMTDTFPLVWEMKAI